MRRAGGRAGPYEEKPSLTPGQGAKERGIPNNQELPFVEVNGSAPTAEGQQPHPQLESTLGEAPSLAMNAVRP